MVSKGYIPLQDVFKAVLMLVEATRIGRDPDREALQPVDRAEHCNGDGLTPSLYCFILLIRVSMRHVRIVGFVDFADKVLKASRLHIGIELLEVQRTQCLRLLHDVIAPNVHAVPVFVYVALNNLLRAACAGGLESLQEVRFRVLSGVWSVSSVDKLAWPDDRPESSFSRYLPRTS